MANLDAEVEVVTQQLMRMLDGNGRMKSGVAQRFISDSAWWVDHPKGPVHAPKHHERVTYGIEGWEIVFGANKFLVGQAAERCSGHVLVKTLPQVVKSQTKVEWLKLQQELAMIVRGSVLNFADREYDCYGDLWDDHMRFGAQSINVKDFVNCFYQLAKIQRVCK